MRNTLFSPTRALKHLGVYDLAHDRVQLMALHASKGLAVPVVALVGARRMSAEGEDEREEFGVTQR